MATATYAPTHAGEIKFQYGRPETFALKFLEPKSFDGQFGPRAMFTAADEGYGERKIWLDHEDAANICIELRRLGVGVGEAVRMTKVKHPRGGGHGFLVQRAGAPAAAQVDAPDWVTREEAPEPPSKIEAQLAQSVQMVRTHGREVFQRPAAPAAPAPAAADSVLMAALKTAIDATLEATVYAARKGVELAFTEESIRALAITCYIQSAKGGR
jgi:hypothetical protein